MKKFRFPLQPVLEHRERIEDERKAALAARLRELDAELAELARLNAAYREQSELLRGEHGRLGAEDLRMRYAHIAFLDRSIDAQTATVERFRAAADRAREALLAASVDKKAVEKLKARRRDAHDEGQRRGEQNELDDANARRRERNGENTP